MYDEDWFKEFNGVIDFKEFNLNKFINGIEENISQYEYIYTTNIEEYSFIKIVVLNEHIPHLIGLSRNHHVGLSSYKSQDIFNSIKHYETIDNLNRKDNGWFKIGKNKIVGVAFMYEFLNLINTKTFSTIRLINTKYASNKLNRGKNTFSRDNIYFLIVTDAIRGVEYSLELTKGDSNKEVPEFFPKSIKYNPKNIVGVESVNFNLQSKNRIKSKNKKKKNKDNKRRT